MDRFIDNKYLRWYLAITSSTDSDCYTERHHIIPRSMGGTNKKTNIIRLSFRKHFLVHWLLTKCTVGRDKMRMLHALNLMTKHTTDNRIVASWQFALAKRAQSDAMRGKPSPWKGKSPTEETREKMRDAKRGSTLSSEHKTKIGAANKEWWETAPQEKRKTRRDNMAKSKRGKPLSPEHRKAVSKGKTGTTYDGRNVSASLMGNIRKLGYKDPPETLKRKQAAQLQRKTYNRTGWRWVSHWPSAPSKPWRARIKRRGKPTIELGLFDCPAAAHFAAVVAADIYYSSIDQG